MTTAYRASHSNNLDWVRNVMAHTQKPDFVFRRKGRVHLNRRGRQFSRLLDSRGVSSSGGNAGYTMFWGSVKSTGYPLHSPVSPSLPLPCVTVCHHISTGLYDKVVCVNTLKTAASDFSVIQTNFITMYFRRYSKPLVIWKAPRKVN
jgi:hypothetical protein